MEQRKFLNSVKHDHTPLSEVRFQIDYPIDCIYRKTKQSRRFKRHTVQKNEWIRQQFSK